MATHIAVHQIITGDEKGNRVEINPGTAFTPAKADLAHLEAAGAIKKIEAADLDAESDEPVSKKK